MSRYIETGYRGRGGTGRHSGPSDPCVPNETPETYRGCAGDVDRIMWDLLRSHQPTTNLAKSAEQDAMVAKHK
jgi:hypothetical protein